MAPLNPDEQRAADLERCRALCAAYVELADTSPQDDATIMKLIEWLEEVDELMYSGRVPRNADGGISRFNLQMLYARNGSWERQLRWVRRWSEHEPSPTLRARWFDWMAKITARLLGDPARAASFVREAIELDPRDEGFRLHLQSLEKQAAEQPAAPDGAPSLAPGAIALSANIADTQAPSKATRRT